MSKELMERAYAEMSKGNLEPMLDTLAEDVEWTIIGSTELSGTYRGRRDIVENLAARLQSRLTGPIVFSFERFIADGEYVVMQARGRATSVTGLPYNNAYCVVARFVHGKITYMINYIDTELITSALFRGA
jgi:ketosteroid isomerase-like protein